MTRKGRKARSDHKIGDVTIKEFADSQTSTNRFKKGTLEITENIFDMSANDFIEDEGKRSNKKSKSNKLNPSDASDNQVFSNYPVDIWFLIAQHIRPEDVGRFSLICQTTASICATPGFWFSLYKRHYRHVNERIIPVRLQPDCMVRLHSLRACVIRSLFYTYDPFVERLPTLVKQDFHDLQSFWIVGSWVDAVDTDKNDWNFCYKLRSNAPTLIDRNFSGDSSGSLKNQRDIFFNPEQGCKVLVVTTKKYCPLPDLRGNTSYVLNSINHVLTTNLRDYKLTLIFSNYQKQKVHSTVKTVVYEPVSRVQVLDWWTPAYNELLK